MRQFEHTPASDWWIFLDLDPACQVGHGFDSTEEHGVILAASLAHKGLQEGQAVGLTVNSQSPVWLPPGRSASQRMDILRALALAKPGEYPLPCIGLMFMTFPLFKQTVCIGVMQ